MTAAQAMPSGRHRVSRPSRGPAATSPRRAVTAASAMSVSMVLLSIPDIATTEKKGQTAKKQLKHQAAARA